MHWFVTGGRRCGHSGDGQIQRAIRTSFVYWFFFFSFWGGSFLGIFHYEAQFYRCCKDKNVSGKCCTFHIICPYYYLFVCGLKSLGKGRKHYSTMMALPNVPFPLMPIFQQFHILWKIWLPLGYYQPILWPKVVRTK